MKNLKEKVIRILTDYPKTRDSDIRLTLQLWCTYFPQRIVEYNGKKMIALVDIMDLPREDNIKRVRAIIQNVENRLLPTSWEVAKQRKINEDKWRDYINSSSEHKRI